MIMKKLQVCFITFALLTVVSLSLAQGGKEKKAAPATAKAAQSHVMMAPNEVQWGPGPPSLPPGAQLAVLEGDPSKAGASFTIRGKLPDGYKVPPHWHPTDENVTVLEGTLMVGMGEKFDQAAGHELSAGSYARMPKRVRHYAWAKGQTIIQVHGVGPFEVNYVNPSDDPRKASTK
jgi:hypothetical protein